MPWEIVLELLAVNRLLAPRSERLVPENWFAQTAMDVLLDTDASVTGKDRLYRCLDHLYVLFRSAARQAKERVMGARCAAASRQAS